MQPRKPTNEERRLLVALIARTKRPDLFMDFIGSISVLEMDDEGMGSLRLFVDSAPAASTRMKSQASELQFIDADGAVVIASLNVNEDGYPFELDIWKTTFEPLIRIPEEFADVAYGKAPEE
jgi:hypothetical protein